MTSTENLLTGLFAVVVPLALLSCSDDGGSPTVDAGPADAASVDAEPVEQICGNGILEPGELCDDGNQRPNDSCNFNCTQANCLAPTTHGSIQEAIDDWGCSTVYVYSGVYTENLSVDRELNIAGVGTAEVIVDGGQSGSVLTHTAGNLSVSNVTLRNGRANRGAGVYSTGPTLAMSYVVVTDNTAVGIGGARGGGIYHVGASLWLDDSLIAGNTVTSNGIPVVNPGPDHEASGAGLYVAGLSASIENCTIENNIISLPFEDSRGDGAGILATGTGLSISQDSMIRQNRIEFGSPAQSTEARGAGIAAFTSTLNLQWGTAVEDNVARADGLSTDVGSEPDAVAHGGGLYVQDSEVSVFRSRVVGNRAEAVSESWASGRGGAMFIQNSTVTVADSVIDNNATTAFAGGQMGANRSEAEGGGVYMTGSDPATSLSFTDSTLLGNLAEATLVQPGNTSGAGGGGIYAHSFSDAEWAIVDLVRTTAADNIARSDGEVFGGMLFGRSEASTARVRFSATESTISGNRVEGLDDSDTYGGALALFAGTDTSSTEAFLINTTVSGNQATSESGPAFGGGLYIQARSDSSSALVQMSNVTMADNLSGFTGGNLFLSQPVPTAEVRVTLRNSIVANGVAPVGPDCFNFDAPLTSAGYNLMSDTSDCTIEGSSDDLVGDPMLESLTDNGGPTQTQALASDSPLIDAANPAGCTDHDGLELMLDQRGLPRVAQLGCDVGAYEYK